MDPQTDTWTLLAPMPTGRSGWRRSAEFHEVEVYDPRAGQWVRLPLMPTPRYGFSASVIGNRIYLPGEATQPGFGATRVNDAFVLDVLSQPAVSHSRPR